MPETPQPAGTLAVRRRRVRLPQPARQPDEAPDLGRHRRVAVPAAPAPRPLRLAAGGHEERHADGATVELAGDGRGLAAAYGAGAGTLASVRGTRTPCAVVQRHAAMTYGKAGRAAGRQNPGMELHAELERLIADPAVAESVTQFVEKLLTGAREQAERQAREVERRDGELHAARSKIQALTLDEVS